MTGAVSPPIRDRLEPGEAIPVAFGLQGRESRAATGRPGDPDGSLIERPAEEPPATRRDPLPARALPGRHPHDVDPARFRSRLNFVNQAMPPISAKRTAAAVVKREGGTCVKGRSRTVCCAP